MKVHHNTQMHKKEVQDEHTEGNVRFSSLNTLWQKKIISTMYVSKQKIQVR